MATRTTLNISLPPELGKFIELRVASGRYGSASEVIRTALRLLEECEGKFVPPEVSQRHNDGFARGLRPRRSVR